MAETLAWIFWKAGIIRTRATASRARLGMIVSSGRSWNISSTLVPRSPATATVSRKSRGSEPMTARYFDALALNHAERA